MVADDRVSRSFMAEEYTVMYLIWQFIYHFICGWTGSCDSCISEARCDNKQSDENTRQVKTKGSLS